MRWSLVVAVLAVTAARAQAGTAIRCDDLSTADLSIDGLLDDWPKAALIKAGSPTDGQVELRCSWDGTAFALSLDIKDDRLIRVRRGKAHEDHVTITISAGGKPVVIDAFPGNSMAKARIVKPPRVVAADSLQPRGFSLEVRVPGGTIAGLSGSTPSLDVGIVFHDSDQATGGDDTDVAMPLTIELGDRKDLLEDFLRSVRLKRSDVKLDQLANLDPDRKGNERIVAGGTVIGVLTDQYAFVSLPAASAADVRKVELLPLGAGNQKVVSAVVRQSGNGGSRDLLMLWTVWSGQLQPLGQIEIRKVMGGNTLETGYTIGKGKKGPELRVAPKPAIGWTADTWNEEPASDADPILLPWDPTKGGIAYTLRGAELSRRDLPAPKKPRRGRRRSTSRSRSLPAEMITPSPRLRSLPREDHANHQRSQRIGGVRPCRTHRQGAEPAAGLAVDTDHLGIARGDVPRGREALRGAGELRVLVRLRIRGEQALLLLAGRRLERPHEHGRGPGLVRVLDRIAGRRSGQLVRSGQGRQRDHAPARKRPRGPLLGCGWLQLCLRHPPDPAPRDRL